MQSITRTSPSLQESDWLDFLAKKIASKTGLKMHQNVCEVKFGSNSLTKVKLTPRNGSEVEYILIASMTLYLFV